MSCSLSIRKEIIIKSFKLSVSSLFPGQMLKRHPKHLKAPFYNRPQKSHISQALIRIFLSSN